MTLTSTPPKDAGGELSAAETARARRERRLAKMAALQGSSSVFPTNRITARQIPFVAVLVALLGAGLAGVLWLNTLTDEAGIRTNAAKNAAAAAQIRIEGLQSDIAAKSATPAIAAAARALGLVPAGDAAILVVPTDGGDPSVVGTPTAVPDPVAMAAAAQAAAADAAAKAAAEAAAKAAADAAAAAAAQAAAVQAQAEVAAQAQAQLADQSNAVQSNAVQSNAVQSNAVQSNAVQSGVVTEPAAGQSNAAPPAPDSNVAVPTEQAVTTTQGAAG